MLSPYVRPVHAMEISASKESVGLPQNGQSQRRSGVKLNQQFSPMKVMHRRLLNDLERVQGLIDQSNRSRKKESMLSQGRIATQQ